MLQDRARTCYISVDPQVCFFFFFFFFFFSEEEKHIYFNGNSDRVMIIINDMC